MKSFDSGRVVARFSLEGFLCAILAFAALSALTSCDAAGLVPQARNGKVTLGVAINGAESRTVGPELPSIAGYELVTWDENVTLKILGAWNDLSGASIAIEPGTWDFGMAAYDDQNRPVLSGYLLGYKVSGPGTLSFALSDTKRGIGSVSLRVSFPEVSGIVEAWAAFREEETELEILDDAAEGMNYVLFEATATSGDYGLAINFHDDIGNRLSTVVELVKLRDNLTSRKSLTLAASDIAGPPSPLSSLSSSPADGVKGVALSWAYAPGAVNTASGYRIYRRQANEPESAASHIFSVDGGTTFAVTDSSPSLLPGAEYSYIVVPYNQFGFNLVAASPTAQSRPCVEVSFDSRGGSAIAPAYVNKGQSLGTLPAAPTKSGAIFLVWFADPISSTALIGAGTVANSDMTAYARWERPISFMPNGAAGMAYSQNAVEGIAQELQACAFTRDGYSFVGWALSPRGKVVAQETGLFAVSDVNYTLYARWVSDAANPASDFNYQVDGDSVKLTFYTGSATTVRVPELIDGFPVDRLEASTFQSKFSLYEVYIEDVPSLADSCFVLCQNLRVVKLNPSLTRIPLAFFYFCYALESVNIPSGVTFIGNYAFKGCRALTSMTIPAAVTEIASDAFFGCSALTSLTVLNPVPPILGNNAIDDHAAGRLIYVPAGSVSAYQSAPGWSTYASAIRAIP